MNKRGLIVWAALLVAAGCSRPAADVEPASVRPMARACPPLAASRTAAPAVEYEAPQLGGAEDSPFGVTLGIRPVVKVERSDPPDMLELKGPFGYELGLWITDEFDHERVCGRFSLTYIPMEEKDNDSDVNVLWLDLGAGFQYPFWDGPFYAAASWEVGLTPTWFDYEKSTYDFLGLGMYTRGILGLYGETFPLGLELSTDVRGYGGFDAHDVQTAWAWTLGVNLVIKF